MLFSSENNCNSSIETIIKDKITLIDNNNNSNLINLNLTSNLNTLNNLNTLSNLSLNQNNKLINNENANYLCSTNSVNANYLLSTSSDTPSRQSLVNVQPSLLSPLEKENAKELIQQKILDNVMKTQRINEENQELANYLANINEDKINKDQNVNNNVLSNNSNDLVLNNGDAYVTPDLSISQFAPSQEQNGLYLGPIFSPVSQSADETLNYQTTNETFNYQTTNELMNLENILNESPNNFLVSNSANQVNSFLSTPNSTILSSPMSNTINSSPELYDNSNPELNLTNLILNDLALEEYYLNQEIIKLQQEALMNSNLLGTENQVPSSNLLMENIAVPPQNTPELLNKPLEIPEIPLNFDIELNDVFDEQQDQKDAIDEQQNQKRKHEEEEDEDEELVNKKSKKENVINEGKPFIYVITESDDEDEENSGSEEDSQKKKKYKKKFFVCSVCGHKSKRHYNVEVHLKTHEKNRPRPFECEVCKKCFCRSHDLERHKIIHQEKMYSCELCGKKFGRLDSLKRHIGCKTCIKRQQLNNKEIM